MSQIEHRSPIELASPHQESPQKPPRGFDYLHGIERNLGEREREVLAVLWKHGNSTVQQVASRLSVSLAYTTVMTTLDRLFKKGLALREKHDRAFLYSAALTEEDMARRRAAGLIHHFFDKSSSQHGLLLSHLVDAVHRYDTGLLTQLEHEIRIAKLQRCSLSQPEEPS